MKSIIRKTVFMSALLLLAIASLMFPCRADEVWSDDFDDGDFAGWMVGGWVEEGFTREGTFSAADNTLRPPNHIWNFAAHPSTVAIGTWSFDVYVESSSLQLSVTFMRAGTPALLGEWTMTGTIFDVTTGDGYVITISPRFALCIVWAGGTPSYSVTDELAHYDPEGDIAGRWQHIDVTRDEDGRICVYLNGTLRMDVVDTLITTSDSFTYASQRGSALDNVVVSDTVDITPPSPPEPTPIWMESWFLAVIGVIVVVVIVVVLRLRK